MNGTIDFLNVDNISRTKAYERFGRRHPEIRWARLAGLVSRNAGWNLTDLTTAPFRQLLPEGLRKQIAWIYERANWLIFSDAYPQLLFYEQGKRFNTIDFAQFPSYSISSFMEKEWKQFLKERDEWRLMIALIINEQYIIETRLFCNKAVQSFFHSALYHLEEWLHFSYVLMPTLVPEKKDHYYGELVSSFSNPCARIELGKRLAALLYTPELCHAFLSFTDHVEPTGSRKDYDKEEAALPLRLVYPRYTHLPFRMNDWFKEIPNHHVESLLQSSTTIAPKKLSVQATKAELQIANWLVSHLSKKELK